MPIVHGGRLNKLEIKLEPGRFIGIRPRSDEALIMTERGIEKARSLRRLPPTDRRTPEDWEDLKGFPWAWKPEKPRLPGMSPIPVSEAVPPPADIAVPADKKSRRTYIRAADVEKFGYTPGCPGCDKVLAGTPGAVGKTHNEKCRARIYKAMDEEEAKTKRRWEESGEENPEGVRRKLEDGDP